MPATYTQEDVVRYFNDTVIELRGRLGVLRMSDTKAGGIDFLPAKLEGVDAIRLSEEEKIEFPHRPDWDQFMEKEVCLPRVHSYCVPPDKRAFFLTRAGTRQTEKGVTRRSLHLIDPTGEIDSLPTGAFSLMYIPKEFPTFGEAVREIKGRATCCVPFSADWCVYNINGQALLGYRGNLVGIVDHTGSPELAPRAEQLRESLIIARKGT